MADSSTPFIVVMGVSGSGKTTVASGLADAIGGKYLEGDAFHPPENKAKMGQGIPLTDEDRWPWFDRLVSAAQDTIHSGGTPVLACSALRTVYRDYLFQSFDEFRLIYLQGSYDLIKGRMDSRDHEYMTSTLLKSQFETLEEPAGNERILVLSIEKTPERLISAIQEWLG